MKKLILQLPVFVCMSAVLNAQTNESNSAAIKFSKEQKPTAANSKEIFTSADFIYGSIDLGGKTVKDYFKLPSISSTNPYGYLYYIAEVYMGDELIGDNTWNFALVKEADKKKTVLNFDVLPDPPKATTVLSGTPVFDAGLASAPLYSLLAKQYFKQSGNYTIRIRIYYRTMDAYGNEEPFEKWPTCNGYNVCPPIGKSQSPY